MRPRVLVVDCEDSFVHTLARYAREHGAETRVVRAREVDVGAVRDARPGGVILSPGPGRPADVEVVGALVLALPDTPVLGVCLGHLVLCEAYGGRTVPSPEPMHGRASPVRHDGGPLYEGLPSPFAAARYHSLIGAPADDLVPDAWTAEGLVMGARHRHRPHHGVQFHPESLLTEGGHRMVGNFVAMTREPTRGAAS